MFSLDDVLDNLDMNLSYSKFQNEIFFLQTSFSVGRSVTIDGVDYPLTYTLRPGLVNYVKGVHVEVKPPEDYPSTPVMRSHKCFVRLYITFYKSELHVYRFNNYLSSFFDLATEEEKKISRNLGMNTLKFAVRWITEFIGRWDRLTLKTTSSTKLLEYLYRNHFKVVCSKDQGCVEMAALVTRFL